MVEDKGTPIAAVLSFYFRDQVLPYYGGGTPAARSRAGNDIMYWEVMKRAADRGCRVFDFGRSKAGTGAYSFKKNWGFNPTPLNYEFKLRVGDTIPDVNPLNPKYRLMIETWKRLPLPVANLLGPMLVKESRLMLRTRRSAASLLECIPIMTISGQSPSLNIRAKR